MSDEQSEVPEHGMIEVRLSVSPQLISDMDEPLLVRVLGEAALEEARRIKRSRSA